MNADAGHLAVVLHDAAPATWPACERVLRAVESVASVPVSILAVPRWHHAAPEAPFERRLEQRLTRGDELVLHGYTHVDDGRPRGIVDRVRRRWYTAGEGEFSALPRDEAACRLQAGVRWFEDRGWPLHGFVAPAWLMSAGTWQALEAFDFRYTCTLRHLHLLPGRSAVASRALVYSTRSAWRRAVSRPWNRVTAWTESSRALLRLELHPHDADHAALRASWMRLLARFVQERRAVTLADAALLAQAAAPRLSRGGASVA